MSKGNKSETVYLLRILECCGKIAFYVEHAADWVTFYTASEQVWFNATLTLLVQLSEQIMKLEETTKQRIENIQWQQIKNFRNIVVHEYQIVNREKVYEISTLMIPNLRKAIEDYLLKAQNPSLLFELELSRNSEFYKHVNFELLTNKNF